MDYRASAEMEIVAPGQGAVSILRTSGDQWSLLFYPGPHVISSLRQIDSWFAPLPNLFVFESGRFRGQENAIEMVTRLSRLMPDLLILRRAEDGSVTEEMVWDATTPAQFVRDFWWDARDVAIVLPVNPETPLLRVDGDLSLQIGHFTSYSALVGPSAGYELYHFDTTEYIRRLIAASRFQDDESIPSHHTAGESESDLFKIITQTSNHRIVLKGGLQDVELHLPAASLAVPKSVLLVSPTEVISDTNASEVVLQVESATSDPLHWQIGTQDLGAHDSRSIEWQLMRTEGFAPFQRELSWRSEASSESATVSLWAFLNPVHRIVALKNQMYAATRREYEVMGERVSGHSHTTLGHIELLRSVLTRLREIDSDGRAVLPTGGTLGRAIDDALDLDARPPDDRWQLIQTERNEIVAEAEALLTSPGVYERLGRNDTNDTHMAQFLMQLTQFPEGRELLNRLDDNNVAFPSSYVSIVRNSAAGLRLSLGFLFSLGVHRVVSDALSSRSAPDAVRRTIALFSPQDAVRIATSAGQGVTEDRAREIRGVGWLIVTEDARGWLNHYARMVGVLTGIANIALALDGGLNTYEDWGAMARSLASAGSDLAFFYRDYYELLPMGVRTQMNASIEASFLISGEELASVVRFGRVCGVVALAIEGILLGLRAADSFQRGRTTAGVFAVVGIVGAAMGIAGTVMSGPWGWGLLLVGLIAAWIGRAGSEEIAGEPHKQIEFFQLVRDLSHCYFGRSYTDADNPLHDNVMGQLSRIYSYVYPIRGAILSRDPEDVYVALFVTQRTDRTVLSIDPSAHIHMQLFDGSDQEICEISFNLGSIQANYEIDPLDSSRLYALAAMDGNAIRIHEASASHAAIALETTVRVEVAVSLTGFSVGGETAAFRERYPFVTRARLVESRQRIPTVPVENWNEMVRQWGGLEGVF